MSNTKEVVLITGATSGLGRETARKCIELGHTVIITGRSQSSLDEAKKIILKSVPGNTSNQLYELTMDLNDLGSIKKAVDTLNTFDLPSLDVIVHNAGATMPTFSQVNNKVESTVFVNSIAPLYLNRLLMPLIEKSTNPKKRIIFVTSSLHDGKITGGSGSPESRIPEDVTLETLAGSQQEFDSMRYYKISKLANVWASYALAKRYPDISVISFCPGFVPATGLARHSSFFLRLIMKYVLPHMSFTTSEEDSTNDYVYYITNDDIQSGKHYQKRKITESSPDSLKQDKIDTFWNFANETIDQLVSK